MLDLAILGLLMDRDHHGYEIRAQLRDRLGLWSNVSFGAIYPALARLERDGLVAAVAVAPKMTALSTGSLAGERAALRARRSPTALNRRGRKSYRITERGRDEFARLLAEPGTADDARLFSLRMALARYLTPSMRIGLLEQRRQTLAERLRDVRAHANSSDIDEYARRVMDHGARSIELEIVWIDEMLTSERTTNEPLAHEPK